MPEIEMSTNFETDATLLAEEEYNNHSKENKTLFVGEFENRLSSSMKYSK